jgi:dimethylamine--corrinoid protein Co-methyltransferase
MEAKIRTRMGDGWAAEMTASEIKADLEDGTQAAAKRAKLPVLGDDELGHLLDIFSSRSRFTGVDVGDEVVLSCDGSGNADIGDRVAEMFLSERHHGADMVELWHIDYSYKAIKTIVTYEAQFMKNVQMAVTVPCNYGAMPDLGRYSQPDGPIANWSELMPQGRIEEARAAQVAAIDPLVADIVHVAEAMHQAGADGMDFDTAGAAGDADFLATLTAIRRIRDKYPDMGAAMGMAGELTLGMHGQLEFEGTRLAGLWPREQMKVAEKAGVTIFGPAVHVNTTRSVAWNVARAITLVKPCCDEATIPIHMNVGMGVGAVPMTPYPPVDAVSRASRALVDILRLDGL